MSSINNKCIYVFLDHRKKGDYFYGNYKFDYEPIYVGKGNLNRPKNHKYRFNSSPSRFHYKYMKIIEETGLEPLYIILEKNLNEEESFKKEIELIRLIGKIEDGGTLTNITDGGEGSSGIIKSKHTIDKFKISINQKYIKNLKKRKENFIKKCNIIHNNKYDYSNVIYKNAHQKVEIICPIHGIFEQEPNSHKISGCPDCNGNRKSNNDEFIKKAVERHGNKYDYSNVNYINNRTDVKIGCPIHGEINQTPESHLNTCGCGKCSGNIKSTNEEFITKARKKHGNKYDYSNLIYLGAHQQVEIICPIHGIFYRTARDHYLYGWGCHKCKKEKVQ